MTQLWTPAHTEVGNSVNTPMGNSVNMGVGNLADHIPLTLGNYHDR
jgi:hypothetical protein